ncbi:MAG: hypothetical protein PUI24_08940, partial [Spirochaetales bacterium]|nr:hypothetical protein [Spirochaetales bacterium]
KRKISCFSSSQKKWCEWQSFQCAIALAGNKGLYPQSKPPAEPVVLISIRQPISSFQQSI